MNEHAATPLWPYVNHLAPSAKATAARAEIRETVVLARSFLLHRLGCPFLGLCPRSVAHRHLLSIREEEDTAVRDPLEILLLPLLLLPLLKQHGARGSSCPPTNQENQLGSLPSSDFAPPISALASYAPRRSARRSRSRPSLRFGNQPCFFAFCSSCS